MQSGSSSLCSTAIVTLKLHANKTNGCVCCLVVMFFPFFLSRGFILRLTSNQTKTLFFQKYPHYLVLFGSEPTKREMDEGKYGLTFDIMPFIDRKYGEPDQFLAVVKFFFALNEDHREVKQKLCIEALTIPRLRNSINKSFMF